MQAAVLVIFAAICLCETWGAILPCGGRCFPFGAASGKKPGIKTLLTNKGELDCIIWCRSKAPKLNFKYTSVNYDKTNGSLDCQCGNNDPPFAIPLAICDRTCTDGASCGGPGSVATWFYNYNICGGTAAPIAQQRPSGFEPIMGCYTDNFGSSSPRIEFADNSPKKCITYCTTQKNTTKGIQYCALGGNGTTCICNTPSPWTRLPTTSNNTNCDTIPCPGSIRDSCGAGPGTAVIYVLPTTLPNMFTKEVAIKIDWANVNISGVNWTLGIPANLTNYLEQYTFPPNVTGPTLPPH